MSRLNVATEPTVRTHEGAPARHVDAYRQLRRSVCSALLWESTFYEDGGKREKQSERKERPFFEEGQGIAERVVDLVSKVSPRQVADLAVEVRTVHKLRHMPLLLIAALTKHGSGQPFVKDAVRDVIQRADEMGELLAIIAQQNGRNPKEVRSVLSAQAKKGIAAAFPKFDAYQLAKYNRNGAVTLTDILRLTHPVPVTDEQSALWRSVMDKTIEAPDTWEVNLSAGADKRETFTRLLSERKLGYLAVLRNLRGMIEAGVQTRV